MSRRDATEEAEECGVCLDAPAMLPMQLQPCKHEVCASCLDALVSHAVLKRTALLCIFCRAAVDATDVSPHAPRALDALLAAGATKAAQHFLDLQDALKRPAPSLPPPTRLKRASNHAAPNYAGAADDDDNNAYDREWQPATKRRQRHRKV
jgi:hypothetical protein